MTNADVPLASRQAEAHATAVEGAKVEDDVPMTDTPMTDASSELRFEQTVAVSSLAWARVGGNTRMCELTRGLVLGTVGIYHRASLPRLRASRTRLEHTSRLAICEPQHGNTRRWATSTRSRTLGNAQAHAPVPSVPAGTAVHHRHPWPEWRDGRVWRAHGPLHAVQGPG